MAIGQMGLGLEDTLNLTPFEFNNAYGKFIERIETDREWSFNTRMQVARWQVWRTMCPPDKKMISIYDLVELPGDETLKAEARKRESNEQKFNEVKQRFGKFEA